MLEATHRGKTFRAPKDLQVGYMRAAPAKPQR
jgi:hypothetical protein